MTQGTKDTSLFDLMMKLRSAAALLFDKGIATKQNPQEVQEAIQPLMNQLHAAVLKADLPAQIAAIQLFEDVIGGHTARIEMLRQKIEDSTHHANIVRTAVANVMKSKGTKDLNVGDYLLTLIEVGDKIALQIR